MNNTTIKDNDGIVFLIGLPVVFSIPYLLILKIIISTEDLWDKPGYKLIFHLGICDLIQMATHASTGLVSITECSCGFLRQQLLGGALASSWFSYMTFTTILALNRWVAFSVWHPVQEWFTPYNTKKWILFGYSVGLLMFLSSQTVYNFAFEQSFYTYFYYPEWIAVVDLGYSFLNMLVTAIAYITTCCAIHSITSDTVNVSSEMRAELRLAAQGVTIWLMIMLFMGTWMAQAFGSSSWVYLIINVLVNGTNPVIYIAFNKTIKTKFLEFICWRSNAVAPVSSTNRRL